MKEDISPEELDKRMRSGSKLRIIDVRMPVEYKRCHIPGAENVPLHTFADRLPSVDADETVVLVCQGGVRSETACKRVSANYEHLYNLGAGMQGWEAACLPAEASPKQPWSPERQTHFVAGLLIWTGLVLTVKVNPLWMVLIALPGFGLLLDATTGICPMTLLLKLMPWNRHTCPPRI